LFLFFGWFKKTKRENGRIVFDHANDPAGKNVIFGYLQIGQVWQYFLVTEEKNTRKEKRLLCGPFGLHGVLLLVPHLILTKAKMEAWRMCAHLLTILNTLFFYG
jgi:hypothetical protein